MPANPDSLHVVQVIKRESAALGGDPADDLPFEVPIEPLEDGCEAAAVFLVESGKRDVLAALWRDGVDLRLRDEKNAGSGVTLSDLTTPDWEMHFLLMGA